MGKVGVDMTGGLHDRLELVGKEVFGTKVWRSGSLDLARALLLMYVRVGYTAKCHDRDNCIF